MTIKQLSVFIENKTGRINEVTRVLAENNINMLAFSLADSADFGMLRMIVSDVELAAKVLREKQFAVKSTDVICIHCPNVPGALTSVLDYLAEENVFIEYMYAFAQGEGANIVIRPTDLQCCIEILNRHKCNLLGKSNLYDL